VCCNSFLLVLLLLRKYHSLHTRQHAPHSSSCKLCGCQMLLVLLGQLLLHWPTPPAIHYPCSKPLCRTQQAADDMPLPSACCVPSRQIHCWSTYTGPCFCGCLLLRLAAAAAVAPRWSLC
jgi:hypothetical protein